MIQVSIALVTRNRPESLARTLKSLRDQSVQPFEVVISDDSDLDRTHETKEVADRWDCRYITGPRRGLYANRNHIALACKGTHIRTMDDDHLFPEGHFAKCLEAIQSDPESIWTTGEIGFLDNQMRWHHPLASQLNSSGVGSPVNSLEDNWAIADGSTIYPRTIFDKGHRMIEWFNYGSSYLEFGAYLYSQGFRSKCIQGALIEHHPKDTSIMTRGKDLKVVESALFASICYNLYFQPNYVLMGRHFLSKTLLVEQKLEFIKGIHLLLDRARQRWCYQSS